MDKNDIRREVIARIETFTKKDSWIGAGADLEAADSLIELFVFLTHLQEHVPEEFRRIQN